MEVDILCPTQGTPLPPVRWNYDDIKVWLQTSLEAYRGRVYAADHITDAKKDRAALNHLRDALDDKRREIKKLYLDPYSLFESQCKELTGMVDEQSREIDAQIKAVEEAEKAEKRAACREIYVTWAKELADLVPFEKIEQARWLNKGCTLRTVEDDITTQLSKIRSGIKTIDAMAGDDHDAVLHTYLQNYDLSAALALIEQLRRQREAEKARKEAEAAATPDKPETACAQNLGDVAASRDETPADPVLTVDFRVYATHQQLMGLKDYLKQHGIRYGRVQN